jgi:hypothetical protein
MPSAMDVFAPMPAATATISVSNSSSSTAISIPSTSPGSLTARFYNAGPQTVFVVWGVGAQTASTSTSMPIPSGNTETFSIGVSDHVGAITASSTATLYVTPGLGA